MCLQKGKLKKHSTLNCHQPSLIQWQYLGNGYAAAMQWQYLNQYIYIYLNREYHKTGFIQSFIVTAENLIGGIVIFLFMVTGRGIILICSAVKVYNSCCKFQVVSFISIVLSCFCCCHSP